MAICITDDVVTNNVFASGVSMNAAPGIIRLDFLVHDGGEDYIGVQRVYLDPSALEPFYLEIGAVLDKRRGAEG